MTEWIKTFSYVVVAVAMVGLAFATEWLAQPVVPQEFEQVGTPFYPEFDSPLSARSLAVTTYAPDTSVIHEFNVTWGENGWTISPYAYPADAEDQLEKTAASVVGITREGLASRRESDHQRYGVVDPRSEDITQLQGRGKRITLKDEKGQILLDLIIGKPAEGREGYFYVRKPKEDDVYLAKVDLDLSTRFADWINSDLLGISAADLHQIKILDYSVNQDQGTAEMRAESLLAKGENLGPWTLEGLDEATEQLNTTAVNNLTNVLDELKIIGVRPKPKGLNADLSFDPEFINNQLALRALQQSLGEKGFFFAQGSEGQLQLIGKEGQLIATTGEGIAFDLYFGEQFSGSLFDIEFGDAADAEQPTRLETKTDENASDDQKVLETGRYVFIAARFVPETLEKPEPPESVAEDATEEEQKAAKQAQQDYEAALRAYEQQVADAKQKVEELNARFGEWYYVLSTENFEDLRLSRDALVEAKEAEPKATEPESAGAASKPSEQTPSSAVMAPTPDSPEPSNSPATKTNANNPAVAPKPSK